MKGNLFKIFLFFAIAGTITIFCGCIHSYGNFEPVDELKTPPVCPFKFRIVNIDLEDLKNKKAENALEEEKKANKAVFLLQEALLVKYPQYFTTESEKSFPLAIKISYDKKRDQILNPGSCSAWMMASIFTLGLIPGRMEWSRQWKIILSTGNLRSSEEIGIVELSNGAHGLLGAILQTYKLLPTPPKYHYDVPWKEIVNGFFVPLRSEEILKFIVSAVARLDISKLQEQYISKYSSSGKLLE